MISVFPRVEISGNYPYMQTGETRPACLSCLRVLRYLHEAAHVRTLRPDGRHWVRYTSCGRLHFRQSYNMYIVASFIRNLQEEKFDIFLGEDETLHVHLCIRMLQYVLRLSLF